MREPAQHGASVSECCTETKPRGLGAKDAGANGHNGGLPSADTLAHVMCATSKSGFFRHNVATFLSQTDRSRPCGSMSTFSQLVVSILSFLLGGGLCHCHHHLSGPRQCPRPWANRPDGSSTSGHVIMAAHPHILRGESSTVGSTSCAKFSWG